MLQHHCQDNHSSCSGNRWASNNNPPQLKHLWKVSLFLHLPRPSGGHPLFQLYWHRSFYLMHILSKIYFTLKLTFHWRQRGVFTARCGVKPLDCLKSVTGNLQDRILLKSGSAVLQGCDLFPCVKNSCSEQLSGGDGSKNHYSCSSPSSPTATHLFEGTKKIYRVMFLELAFALVTYLLKLWDVPTQSRQGSCGSIVSVPSCSHW